MLGGVSYWVACSEARMISILLAIRGAGVDLEVIGWVDRVG